jgi:large subunit ribosomal protein L3
MPTRKSPRKGSLQYWPRKRASKILPSVNWKAINSDKKLRGFIGYKAGMISVELKDNAEHSMTKGKHVIIPGTIIECPEMRIFSVRFYKNGKVAKDILAEQLDKELKRVVKIPKNPQKSKNKLEIIKPEEYDDISLIVYSIVKKTNLKKKPDLAEIGLSGKNPEEKLSWIKEHLNKEINIQDLFSAGDLVDTRGLTTGKGFSGPVKRFGIKLKKAKSEKGRRRPGNIGPWHPARVTFRIPMAGQLGMFTRVEYNKKILAIEKASEKAIKAIKNYGDIKTSYIILSGSVQGPSKRQILVTAPLRPSKMQKKKNYEFLEALR